MIRTALVTAVALIAAPLATSAAQAAEPKDATLIGYAQDVSGKPLPNVGWDILELRNGTWTSNLQFGPRITDAKGRFSFKMPSTGTYRVCFSDSYYGYADTSTSFWQPEVRHRDTCWPNTTAVESATSWKPSGAGVSKTFTVKMAKQGLGMAPVEPFVTGTYEVGKPLKVVGQEGWRPTNSSFTYEWLQMSDGAPATVIAGATGASFTPTSAQNGKWVWARVTASRAGYKPVTLATQLSKVGGSHVQITSPLTITGNAASGNTLTASYGKPANTYGGIEWFVDGVPLPSGPSYDTASWPIQLTSAHAGAVVEARLKIYRTNSSGYIDGSDAFHRVQVQVAGARPAQTQPVAPAPKGDSTVGKVLKANVVTADPNASLTYQWMRDGKAIPGATAQTYKLTNADGAKKVTVRATVTRPGWPTQFVTFSHATLAKKVMKKGKITVKGTARVGTKLQAKATGWGPKPVKVSYRWLRNGKSIKGATKSTYKVSKKDRRKSLKVKISVRKGKYATATKTSKSVKVKR